MEIKRETETTASTETEMTAVNKTTPNHQRERERQKAHEYETPGVIFYLLSVQFISQSESVISII